MASVSRWCGFLAAGVFAMFAAAGLASCGGSETEGEGGGSLRAPAPGGESAAGGTGAAGRVTFSGPRPERVVLETEGDPKCYATHVNDPLLSDREVVSEDGGVKSVFVYVKNPPAGDYPVPAERAVLDQVGCRYIPHVLGVRVGQELGIMNSDDTMHNVRSFARKNRPFNNSQPAGTASRVKTFEKPEMAIRMKCDIHPWMTAFIFAMDHPFFATTDESGRYAIRGLPPGEYTVVAWHEKYGEQETKVRVEEGELSAANFTYAP